jgi:L-amino acid N-acyltransferase YncA
MVAAEVPSTPMVAAEVTIRDATPDDLDSIFAIYNYEVEHEISTFDTEPRRPGRDDGWLTDRERRYPVLAAERAGKVIGWGSLSPWSEKGAYARTAEVSVYVDRRHRGEGVGGELLAALIDRAPAGGIAVLMARIAGPNPHSVALHKAAGFDPIGVQRRCGEKFGRVLDVALMDLHLDD